MKRAYVAGAYRSPEGLWGIKKNIDIAGDLAVELWQAGFAVFCPHKNTAFFDGACPDDVWLAGDLEFLTVCHFAVMCPNWESSEGAKAEKAFAGECGIPVYFSAAEAIEQENSCEKPL